MSKRDKKEKVNVPELFYSAFVKTVPRGTSTLVDKLHDTPATARGRGESRVILDLTEAEWDELYQRAAEGRAQMINTQKDSNHRGTILRPAICAKALAERMEKQGVSNPVTYTPKVVRNTSTTTSAPADNQVPADPVTLETADDAEEVDDDTRAGFAQDMS